MKRSNGTSRSAPREGTLTVINIETVKAAQSNDIGAVTTVLEEMSSRLELLATRAARTVGSLPFGEALEHLTSFANAALWEYLPTFKGDSIESFYRQAYRHVEGRLRSECIDLRGAAAGVAEADLNAFGAAMKRADGDPYLAESLATIHPYSTRGRLSADRAHAARLAWQGSLSLDRPSRDGGTLMDALPLHTPDPANLEEIDTTAPARIGLAKVRAALNSLEEFIRVPTDTGERKRLFETLSDLYKGAVTDAHLDVIGENLVLPAGRDSRLFVSRAFGILAASASSEEHTSSPSEDYSNTEDENPGHRATIARQQTVHAVLDTMGEGQRDVVEHSFGIRGRSLFGRGDDGDDDGLAALLGITAKSVRDRRTKGLVSFGKRWITAMARGKDDAEALEAAAVRILGPSRWTTKRP